MLTVAQLRGARPGADGARPLCWERARGAFRIWLRGGDHMWDLRADTTGRIMVGLVACRRVLGRSLALMRRATWVRELARVRGRAGVRELALLRWLAPRRGLGLAEGSALLGGVALTRGPAPVRDLA